jgi:DNA-binding response OmpR family regulator
MTRPRARVLVVEDDAALARALRDGFEYEGYAVRVACDGDEGLRLARTGEIDLIVLDVMLPRVSGLEICRQLRAASDDVPIILLTARSQEVDKVQGLRLGADDYLTKPFAFDELVARVEAVLRRTQMRDDAELLRFGEIAVDFARLRATRAGAPLDLTPREFAILACLSAHRGEVVTRERLLHEVWGYESRTVTRTVDMHIAKLRRKVEVSPDMPEHIITVHGEGYRFIG